MGTDFYTGQEVITRRLKRGTVVEVRETTLLVRFGSKEFEMKKTQLVGATGYDKGIRQATRPSHYNA